MEAITRRLRQLVCDAIGEQEGATLEVESIDPTKSLFADYGISSASLISLVMALENEFDIQIREDHLTLDQFDTVARIHDMLKTHYTLNPGA